MVVHHFSRRSFVSISVLLHAHCADCAVHLLLHLQCYGFGAQAGALVYHATDCFVQCFGLSPVLVMWYSGILIVEQDLPTIAPSLGGFLFQFVTCGVAGDFLHYWTHRLLHHNRFLRHKVHSVHHEYEGSLYSWVGMQVHPVEMAMVTVAIYSPMLAFAHPMVLWTFAFCATLNAAFAHSGYVGGFASVGVPQALASSDHQLHHEKNSTKNFGNILRIWDIMFGTYGEPSCRVYDSFTT